MWFPRLRLVTLMLLVAGGASAQDTAPPPEFQRAYQLAGEEKYDQALQILDRLIEQGSNIRNAFFSAGSIALVAGRFENALEYFVQLKELEPRSGSVRTALVRVNQAIGDLEARDRERDEVFRLWSSGDDPELGRNEYFLRDEFVVVGKRVMALEFFELKGDHALRYAFLVSQPDHDQPDYRISLGSYAATNAVWRELNRAKAESGERIFHLDGYFADGSHATFGMHNPEPSYDAVREMVVRIVGEREASQPER